jgi:D-alanyl-D-alanine carboxypeptidase
MNLSLFYETLDHYFMKMDQHKRPLSFQVSNEKVNLLYTYTKQNKNKPFHIFGISKLFMLAVVDQMVKRKLLDLDKPIHHYIDRALLKNLFVFRDIDYQSEVSSRHLLEHTSGIADYFEGYDEKQKQIIDIMIDHPEHMFNPLFLLDLTRRHQSALGAPGERFYYADTGYVLLGIIIEAITNISYPEALKLFVTEPLNLKHTFVFPTDASDELSEVLYNKIDISTHKSLSCQWGGSGIVSTHDDLHRFMKAIYKDGYISYSITDAIICCRHHFSKGIAYGMGMMSLKLDKLPFLLKAQNIPQLYGHMSFYGTHAWYDPTQDLIITLNYGDNKQYEKGFKVLTKTLKAYHKAQQET